MFPWLSGNTGRKIEWYFSLPAFKARVRKYDLQILIEPLVKFSQLGQKLW